MSKKKATFNNQIINNKMKQILRYSLSHLKETHLIIMKLQDKTIEIKYAIILNLTIYFKINHILISEKLHEGHRDFFFSHSLIQMVWNVCFPSQYNSLNINLTTSFHRINSFVNKSDILLQYLLKSLLIFLFFC